MQLRRVRDHLSRRDWFAVLIELLLVVGGIFIAFEVDRWNEGRRLRATEAGYLQQLTQDFAATRADLQDAIDWYQSAYLAAEALLLLDSSGGLDQADFYAHLDRIRGTVRFEPVTRTYDVLIASGSIDVIRDEQLQAEMAAFFARLKFLEEAEADHLLLHRTIFEPYVNRALDHVALLKQTHPEQAANLPSIKPDGQYIEVLGDDEFKAVLASKWHVAYDLFMNYEDVMARVAQIESLLAKTLPED